MIELCIYCILWKVFLNNTFRKSFFFYNEDKNELVRVFFFVLHRSIGIFLLSKCMISVAMG